MQKTYTPLTTLGQETIEIGLIMLQLPGKHTAEIDYNGYGAVVVVVLPQTPGYVR